LVEKSESAGSIREAVTILVVEDNPVERQLVSKVLRNAGFDVVAVDCGNVVLDHVLEYQPSLILLDGLLPDIDGFEVCQQLRAHPKGVYIPVIMLTGLDDVGSIDRAYEVGATDFIIKPIQHSLLVHRIRYLLRAREIIDQLRVSKQSLAGAQQVAKLGHWEFNAETHEFNCSDELRRLYRFELDAEVKDKDALLLRCHPDDRQYLVEMLRSAVKGQRETRVEHRIVLDDGSVRTIEVHTTLVKGEADDSTHVIGICMDVTERKTSESEILRLAYCDRLTNIPNHSLLELYVDQCIPRAHMAGAAVAMLAIDLDLFNRVNNSMGHGAGDAVLQQLTERLSSLVSGVDISIYLERLSVSTNPILYDLSRDMLARFGADNFIIVLNEVSRHERVVTTLAENIRQGFQQPFLYRGQELFVTGSIGIAYSESGGSSAESLLQRADLALHEAKSQGRNEIREYSGDLVEKVSAHLAIQTDLRKALKNNEFQLYYQPKICLADGSVKGFEALIRWFHPVKGLVSPDQFITIAEETGQIVEIGQWVMNTACQQNQQWLDEGLVDVRVAVNVSARQFKEGNLNEVVDVALSSAGLNAVNLEIEITEGVLMSDPHASDIIAELRNKGVSISLDDFGTEYSSLSYITRFPIDTIKIDRCFVQDIAMGTEKAAIVAAVTGLSHGLSFNVVAEGVETEQELEVIRALGCDEVQGYYYCRPMPAQEIGPWLRQLSCGNSM